MDEQELGPIRLASVFDRDADEVRCLIATVEFASPAQIAGALQATYADLGHIPEVEEIGQGSIEPTPVPPLQIARITHMIAGNCFTLFWKPAKWGIDKTHREA